MMYHTSNYKIIHQPLKLLEVTIALISTNDATGNHIDITRATTTSRDLQFSQPIISPPNPQHKHNRLW